MKPLLLALAGLMLSTCCFAQKIYQIRADSVRIYNTCDTAELILENRTQDTLGFLYNKGKGRTEFRRLQLAKPGPGQLSILGQDTIDLDFAGFGDTRYDLLSTNFVRIDTGTSKLWHQWPINKVVAYDAYNSPDMPVLSNQAFQSTGSRLYYNGLVVQDGNTGFDLAVNWDGELNGPNGAFIRTKDDTKQSWSAWRELVFKDYADTAYSKAQGGAADLQTVTDAGNITSQNITAANFIAPGSGELVLGSESLSGPAARLGFYNGSGYAHFGTPGFYGLSLETSNTPRIYITPQGNVGIAETNPTNKLVLPNNQSLAWKNAAGSGEPAGISLDGTDVFTLTNGYPAVRITSDGFVGIGGVVPAFNQLVLPTNQNLAWQSSGGGETVMIGADDDNTISITNNLGTRIVVNGTSGNVGIAPAATVPTSTLTVNGSFAPNILTATNITLDNDDFSVVVNNTGPATIALSPAANCPGRIHAIKKVSASSGNNVTITPGGGTIDGVSSRVLTLQYSSIIVQSTGTEWIIIGAYTQSAVL